MYDGLLVEVRVDFSRREIVTGSEIRIDKGTQLYGQLIQGGREVTVHPDNTHLRLYLSLHSTAPHAVQCKMVVWQQCPR